MHGNGAMHLKGPPPPLPRLRLHLRLPLVQAFFVAAFASAGWLGFGRVWCPCSDGGPRSGHPSQLWQPQGRRPRIAVQASHEACGVRRGRFRCLALELALSP